MDHAIQNPSWLRRHGLSLIFLFAYAMLALLIFEQGRTIDSQRQLIRQLFSDSLELTHLKAGHIAPRR